MYERDLLRDSAMSSSLGFDFLTPFLDKDLVKYSLSIPIKYKLNNSGNKLILRKAAYPLLKEHSERPKRAAQYGSSFDRALSKVAKMHGFEYKKDYIDKISAQYL
jgi:asparagine synthase (glutamine-hydrolysing)